MNSNLKICVVGVCDVPQSTNAFMANALEELGHKVLRYNYRTILKHFNGNTDKLAEDFMNYIHRICVGSKTPPDLFIFCKTDTLQDEAMAYASMCTKTWYWFMDPITTARSIRAPQKAMACTYASATCNEVVNLFKSYGQNNTYRIIEGFEETIYYPKETKKDIDVLFVGSYTQKRDWILSHLLFNDINVEIRGAGWPQVFGAKLPIYNEQFVDLMRRSKIILNISHTDSYSDRVVLSLASGSFLISEDVQDLKNEFIYGNHLIEWRNKDHLVHQINYYLDNQKEREKIASCGCKYVHANFTWKKVCNRILKEVR